MEMGQAPGDWQQESGSHRLDPVPKWSLSVFPGWGRGWSLTGRDSLPLGFCCLSISLSISLSLSSCPPSPSLCVCFTSSLSVYFSVSISVSVESMRTLDLTGVFTHGKGGLWCPGSPLRAPPLPVSCDSPWATLPGLGLLSQPVW